MGCTSRWLLLKHSATFWRAVVGQVHYLYFDHYLSRSASLTTPGTADSFLKASHVTRTRRAHQITDCSLYLLQQKAYTEYCNGVEEECNKMSLEDWCDQRVEACPLFLFWSIILQLELDAMIYVRAIREGDFLLYIDALTKLVPWFFALGHTNYARWIPVYLRDMVSLHDKHPGVFAEFRKKNGLSRKQHTLMNSVMPL